MLEYLQPEHTVRAVCTYILTHKYYQYTHAGYCCVCFVVCVRACVRVCFLFFFIFYTSLLELYYTAVDSWPTSEKSGEGGSERARECGYHNVDLSINFWRSRRLWHTASCILYHAESNERVIFSLFHFIDFIRLILSHLCVLWYGGLLYPCTAVPSL